MQNITIWNKTIQDLVLGDEDGIKLALHLISDRKSLIVWTFLSDWGRRKDFGLPFLNVRKSIRIRQINLDIFGKRRGFRYDGGFGSIENLVEYIKKLKQTL